MPAVADFYFTVKDVADGEWYGGSIQGAFLCALTATNQPLAIKLHDGDDVRVYTISPPLVDSEKLHRHLRDGDRVKISVASLEDAVVEEFAKALMHKPDMRINTSLTLVSTGAKIQRKPINELIFGDTYRDMTLDFMAPTVFKDGCLNMPLPIPRSIFSSLARRFNSGIGAEIIPDDFYHTVYRYCIIADYDMRSVYQLAEKKQGYYGFVGSAKFTFHKGTPDQIKRYCSMLARSAMYTGCGKQASRCFGMAALRENTDKMGANHGNKH